MSIQRRLRVLSVHWSNRVNSVNPEGIEPRRDLVQKIEAWDGRWGRLVLERLRVQMADADPAHGLEPVPFEPV